LQLSAQRLSALTQRAHFIIELNILLLTNRQIAHHCQQTSRHRASQRGDAATARCRRCTSQFIQKTAHRLVEKLLAHICASNLRLPS